MCETEPATDTDITHGGNWLFCNSFTCSSDARLENIGIISLFTYSSSNTFANSPNLEAAARLTIGVSSEHRFRKCLNLKEAINIKAKVKEPKYDPSYK